MVNYIHDYIKDINATLDYTLDWGAFWLPPGDIIATSTWSLPATNPDTVLTIQSFQHTQTTATVWLTSGTLGNSYLVENKIVTAAGRTDERSIKITVRER